MSNCIVLPSLENAKHTEQNHSLCLRPQTVRPSVIFLRSCQQKQYVGYGLVVDSIRSLPQESLQFWEGIALRNTRQDRRLHCPRTALESGKRSFSNFGPQVFERPPQCSQESLVSNSLKYNSKENSCNSSQLSAFDKSYFVMRFIKIETRLVIFKAFLQIHL